MLDQRRIDTEPVQFEASADFRRAGQQVFLRDAFAALGGWVQGMAPNLMLFRGQQAVSRLITIGAGMTEKGPGDLQAVIDLLQHLAHTVRPT